MTTNLKIQDSLDNKIFNSLTTPALLGTTVREIKGSQTNFYGYVVHNPNAAVAWVQVFNLPAADVTLGTTAPSYTIKTGADGGLAQEFVNPINMKSGLSVAATTTETGSTANTTGLSVNILFK